MLVKTNTNNNIKQSRHIEISKGHHVLHVYWMHWGIYGNGWWTDRICYCIHKFLMLPTYAYKLHLKHFWNFKIIIPPPCWRKIYVFEQACFSKLLWRSSNPMNLILWTIQKRWFPIIWYQDYHTKWILGYFYQLFHNQIGSHLVL